MMKITRKQKLEQIDKISDILKQYKGLKTGELINENLPNGKLNIGTNFGKYGFTITKQKLEEKEDNVSVYVLQRHPYVYSSNFFFFTHK